MDSEWFDEKYKGGGKPTLRDRAELFKEFKFHFSERQKREIKDDLDQCLHELRREYKPSLQVKVYELLFCFAPISGMDKKMYNDYVKNTTF